jgi:hypothetical protein
MDQPVFPARDGIAGVARGIKKSGPALGTGPHVRVGGDDRTFTASQSQRRSYLIEQRPGGLGG